MRKLMIIAALALGSQAAAQFKPVVVQNGITYTATVNTPTHATYIQQDYKDFSLAPDSFYVDVMTDVQWDFASDRIVAEGGVWANGMYHLPNGCQVFVSDDRDKHTGGLLIIRLFGSVDE